ncbi:hypothetical protein [Nonomuraea sp. NPDC049784]|uniref:hypothetical protein n=1 Tax=Nonomuraea sp. NPDC049784 TaxID=3154361 RepID=UPI0033EF665D
MRKADRKEEKVAEERWAAINALMGAVGKAEKEGRSTDAALLRTLAEDIIKGHLPPPAK